MYDMCARDNAQTDFTPFCRSATALAHECSQKGFYDTVDLTQGYDMLTRCSGEFMKKENILCHKITILNFLTVLTDTCPM